MNGQQLITMLRHFLEEGKKTTEICSEDRRFQLGFEPGSSCTWSTKSSQYIAIFVQLCLRAQFTCYLPVREKNLCRAARCLIISHATSCKFVTETSSMHAGSCDLVTLRRKWLHQNVGSANQCELLHFCTITQLSWPRVMWGQDLKSGFHSNTGNIYEPMSGIKNPVSP
jgi:hypothetical protein